MTRGGFDRLRPGYPADLLLVDLDGTRSATNLADELRGAGHPVGSPVLDKRRIGAQELSGTALSDTTAIPLLLGVLMAVMGLAVIICLVAVATAARRRELSTLRALGLRPRQVLGAAFVQATILFGLAFAAALPIGLIAGRATWRLTAERLGVLDRPSAPWIEMAYRASGAPMSDALAAAHGWLQTGSPPDRVGLMVLEAIKADRLYIHTDRMVAPRVEARAAAILEAMPAS